MGQEPFQQETGRGHVRIHQHFDSSSGDQGLVSYKGLIHAFSMPSLPWLSFLAESMALVITAHVCSVQKSSQSTPEFTYSFISLAILNGVGVSSAW